MPRVVQAVTELHPVRRPPLAEPDDQVVETVAGMLLAADDGLVPILRDLVVSWGGELTFDDRRGPCDALRVLPREAMLPGVRSLALGPLLRALTAAALERADGQLRPPRSAAEDAGVGGPTRPQGAMLVAVDLGDLARLHDDLGDAGAAWLIDKLHRTLRTLLRSEDRALRYPASRFLVLLQHTTPARASHFARRLSWEWAAYLGRGGAPEISTEPVGDADLVGALHRVIERSRTGHDGP